MSIGISYNDFWGYTPRIVLQILESYKRERQRQVDYDNFLAYLQGRYFVDSLYSTVGNMFSKKGAKPIEYPKEPYDLEGEKELTQEEKDTQAKAIIDNLMRMKESFERSKQNSNK